MSNNNQSNQIIKWLVIAGDFVLLNVIEFFAFRWFMQGEGWAEKSHDIFILISNLALLLGQFFFSTIIYQRLIAAGDAFRRIVGLSITQAVVTYVLLRVFGFEYTMGWFVFGIGTAFFVLLMFKRMTERLVLKMYRRTGRNTRSVVFVGSDPELIRLYDKMKADPSTGYNVLGYYADTELGSLTHTMDGVENDNAAEADENALTIVRRRNLKRMGDPIKKLGTLQEFISNLNRTDNLVLGEDLYLCISRRDKSIIRRVSQMCDRKVIRFYYVPVSVESLGLNLKSELIEDIEVFTTHDNPLQNPMNRAIKRTFDIVSSIIFLIPTAIIFPFVYVIVKTQSPGPLFFKQKRTGLDGKEFDVLKFRSMHVNADADKVQATKDDPRKYPFGNFMRKANIDELPQFINVLKGDMSIVGPRPHMLAHTEEYSDLIEKYMVRHFVKPGVTGWAQVTGYRGETKELWQMEGRVKRDIWYIEHWSFWLDVRIIWMTVKSIFIHDKNAY